MSTTRQRRRQPVRAANLPQPGPGFMFGLRTTLPNGDIYRAVVKAPGNKSAAANAAIALIRKDMALEPGRTVLVETSRSCGTIGAPKVGETFRPGYAGPPVVVAARVVATVDAAGTPTRVGDILDCDRPQDAA